VRAGPNFDVLFGGEYEFALSQPPRFSPSGLLINPEAHRIKSLRWNGADVTSQQSFAVATNSYRVSGGGNFKMVQEATRLQLPAIKIRDAICDYVAGHVPKDSLEGASFPWRLAGLAGTKITAFTGPVARNYLEELPADLAEDQGITPSGFLKLRLTL
jgi:2',3'-cyclic-nucleotide 2'-phosphodiesterase/3'-nucleotidase